MKNKYIHVLVCSLKGISLLLTYTTRNTQKKPDVIALVQPLIQNPKFWKMSKHKHSMVKIIPVVLNYWPALALGFVYIEA